MARLVSVLLVLCFGFLAPVCDSRVDEVDLEEQQWQFLLLTLPVDVQSRCQQAASAALSCASSAGNISVRLAGATVSVPAGTFYTTYHETIYSVSVAAPKGASELCQALVASPNYPAPGQKNSSGARVCYHDCEKELWDRYTRDGRCTASGFSSLTRTTGSGSSETTILALSQDSAYAGCTTICLTRGTLLPQ